MAKVGNFESRDQGMMALGILQGAGIAGELAERPKRTFELNDERFGGLSIEVADSDEEAAARVLNPHFDMGEAVRSASRETPVSGRSGSVPIWAWLVVGVTIVILIANQGPRFQRTTGLFLDRHGIDRNGDGRVDEEYAYDSANYLVSVKQDNNFDGKWDVDVSYDRSGQPISSWSDTDFDGFFEQETRYRFGIAVTTEIREHEGGSVLRRYDFEHGVLSKESVDRDGDGSLEEVLIFDALGNPTTVRSKARTDEK